MADIRPYSLRRGINTSAIALIAGMSAAPVSAAQLVSTAAAVPGEASTSPDSIRRADSVQAVQAAPVQVAADGSGAAATEPANAGDIIVTAQKRSERLNDVPISIVALGESELQKQGVNSPSDLARVVPGFTAATSVGFAIPVYTLRGVGFYDVGVSALPAVSVYVDEVPLPYSAMTSGAAIDLQRVEVLKGPQGTLFGQNSTGGLINYIAAKPLDSFHAGGQIDYGRFNALQLQGFVTGPLSEGLNARAAFRLERSDNWQRSFTTGEHFGGIRRGTGRILVDWHASEKLLFTLNLNGWVDKSHPQMAQLIAVVPSIPPAASPALLTQPLSPQRPRAANANPNDDFYTNNSFGQSSLRIEYQVGNVTLTSLTAYSRFHQNYRADLDGSTLEVAHGMTDTHVSSFSQEVRAQGAGDLVNWTVGANYSKNKINGMTAFDLRQSSLSVVLDKGGARTIENADNEAVFAGLQLKPVTNLTVEGSARYTKTHHTLYECTIDRGAGQLNALLGSISSALTGQTVVIPPGGCVTIGSNGFPTAVRNRLNEENFSWRGSVSWKPAPRTLLYGYVSKGYKDGAFPNLAATSYTQYDPAVQESLLAYEVGFKSGDLARWLQVNGSAFYYDYSNKQVRGRFVDPVFGTLEKLLNIPKSRVQGLELELGWQPPTGLRLSASGSYLDTKVTRTFSNYTPFGVMIDFKGERYPFTPKFQEAFDAEYRATVGSDLTGSVGAHLTYQSKTNAAFGNVDLFRIKPVMLVDLRASIESHGDWTASIWARNVLNRYYWTGVGYYEDNVVRYAGMPATYGISLAFRY